MVSRVTFQNKIVSLNNKTSTEHNNVEKHIYDRYFDYDGR